MRCTQKELNNYVKAKSTEWAKKTL